ncbi:DNA polymerase III subunit epsilon [compost metagenome]
MHGALLDAELLAEVYLAMTRGQNSLSMDLGASDVDSDGQVLEVVAIAPVQLLLASEEEMAAHAAMVESLDKQVKGQSVWRKLEAN